MLMSTIKYLKLVRDHIPEIIAKSGKRPVYSILSDEAYLAKLDEKLNEELSEYQESKSMEELADLLEVIRAVAAARGSSIEEVEAIRRDKAAKRGGFEKKILLTEVIEDE
jgi:predicted house-cleaning noncanonical NTP pyrophosphatase (MazG superfamily)